MDNKVTEQQTQQNCVTTGPPIEVVPNCIPPSQYGTYPPIPSLQQMQRLKEYVQSLTQNQGVTPESSLQGLTILGQPHNLLNLQGKNGPNDAPQLINSQMTYFAPTYATAEHKECINRCEDCCEDVCENCFLNCCLYCSKITQLFGTSNGRLIKNGNKGDYILLENTLPLNPLAGYPPTQISIQSVNPLTGAPIAVYPIHLTAVCSTNPCYNGINAITIGNIKL